MSLSARRAWIEISSRLLLPANPPVALRKESVDRNHVRDTTATLPSMSLSARRAWIEISRRAGANTLNSGRSPQGERG